MAGSSITSELLPAMPTWNQQRVMQNLDRLLDDPDICPRGVLPAERKLAELLGISRQTLRIVLSELQQHGRINTLGSTRVAVRRPKPALPAMDVRTSSARAIDHRTIGVVWAHGYNSVRPLLDNRVPAGSWSQVRFGIADALQVHGDSVLLLQPKNLSGKPVDWLSQQRLDGLIAGTGTTAEISEALVKSHQAGRPVVASSDEPWSQDMDRVVPDHRGGAYALTELLIKRGRRKILRFWNVAQNDVKRANWLTQRDMGYEQAMTQAGLPVMPALEAPEPSDTYKQVGEWFELCKHLYAGYLAEIFIREMPNAIMAVTDGNVPALIAACKLLGKRVPEDVAVVGFDNYWADVPERRFEPTPPWASVDKHNHAIGEAMVDVLLARLEGKSPAQPQLRVVKSELVVLAA